MPVDSSYGPSVVRHRSRSVTRRRFGSKCNPRGSDCRSVDFAIPASLRRLAFTKRDTLPDGVRMSGIFTQIQTVSLPNLSNAYLALLIGITLTRRMERIIHDLVALQHGRYFFAQRMAQYSGSICFCCLILAVLTTTAASTSRKARGYYILS